MPEFLREFAVFLLVVGYFGLSVPIARLLSWLETRGDRDD